MIKVYTLKDCQHCKQLKELLINDSILFNDIDIDLFENQMEYAKISKLTQCDEVPIIIVKGNVLLPHISFKTIEEAVSLIKQFLTS